MPRERKGGIVTRDGKLYARIRFTDETGKQRAIWRKADNKAHARQLLRALLKEIENSTPQQLDAANMTFAELADHYITNYLQEAVYVGERKVSGVRGVSQALCSVQPLKDHFGNRKLRSITYADIRAYKHTRLQTPTIHGKQRSIAPVNRELSKLRRMFNIAVQQGWLLKSPFTGGDALISLADEKHRERILTREEEIRLLAAIDAEPLRKHLRGVVLIALDCALRRGEILTLTWSDIDIDRRTITVRAFNAKTARARTVAMTSRVYEELRGLYEAAPRTPDECLFPVKDVKRSFGSACRAAGITDFRFHDQRHTAITRMIRAGMPPVEVMRVSGHNTMAAFYRYANLDSDAVFRAAAALDAYLAGTPATEPQRPVESAMMVGASQSVN